MIQSLIHAVILSLAGHKNQSTTYDLVAIISHHGAAGGIFTHIHGYFSIDTINDK